MPAADPFLALSCSVIAFAALATLKPVIAARREARRSAREARERARRVQETIAALREARRPG